MGPGELLRLIVESVRSRPSRSALTMLGIVIGIAAVVLLGGVGEGARRAIAESVSQFGTTTIEVSPGRSETGGVSPGRLVGTTRPLTVADAQALRRLPGVREINAIVFGTARIEVGRRHRDVVVYGSLGTAPSVWRWGVSHGTFLPAGDPDAAPGVCVLGATVARELFGDAPAVGQPVRVGDARFRVTGVMARKGTILGMDLDDTCFLPLVRAMRLFNRDGLAEIHLDAVDLASIPRIEAAARAELRRRHDGTEDFTLQSHSDALAAMDNVLTIVTRGVLAIAGIAILVGAMGIFTITWLTVHERTAEIGLCKAIGASAGQVVALVLGEAVLLGGAGGVAGIVAGLGLGALVSAAVPAVQVTPGPGLLPLCLALSIGVGALAGWLPARRAARLDPIEALREE